MKTTSSYSYEQRGSVIVIHDEHGNVLNNCISILADLASAGFSLSSFRFLCRDPSGIWGELMLDKGRYMGFRDLGVRDLAAALAKVEKR